MRRRPDHALRVTIGVAVMAALWFAGLHVGGLETGLLFLTPAFVLLLPLLAGRYVGERVLAVAPPARRTVVRAVHRPGPATRLVPRGGLLVGCSLAGRAPPVA